MYRRRLYAITEQRVKPRRTARIYLYTRITHSKVLDIIITSSFSYCLLLTFHHFCFQPLGAYSVSKTTLLGLTKAIASEVVHDNIRVNCVAPGIVATKFASAVST